MSLLRGPAFTFSWLKYILHMEKHIPHLLTTVSDLTETRRDILRAVWQFNPNLVRLTLDNIPVDLPQNREFSPDHIPALRELNDADVEILSQSAMLAKVDAEIVNRVTELLSNDREALAWSNSGSSVGTTAWLYCGCLSISALSMSPCL